MDKQMECIEINIPTSTHAKPELHETDTKFGAKEIWVQIQSVWEFCKEDTGREIFALKVGITVLLVSLFVLFEAPYQVFGSNIIWAILTAIIVFEDTVGATFNRGFNRAVGTLVAVILAVVVAETALSCGHVAEPIILGLSMFMIAVITSYMKMWGALVQYEYGFRVTLMTYCLIVVSDYRIGNPVRTMIDRLYSIAIGGMISVLVNVSIFPIWAGDQLHKELVKNFHLVADSFEECTKKYLEDASEKSKFTMSSIDAFHEEGAYMRCQSTLDSGSRFQTLAQSAKWEPPHGKFMHISYPWLQYVKVGAVLRHCAYEVMALHSIAHAKIQVPYKLRVGLESEVEEASKEAAEVVRILGRDISHMQWSVKDSHVKRLHNSIKRLQSCMCFQYSYMLASTFDNPSKSFANISHMFYHLPYQREMMEEEVECYHHMTGKQLRRLYSWPPREADAFEDIKLEESTAMLSFTNFASSLMEFVARVEHLVEAVHELSKMAKFKSAL
ncbi:aluminum-activated malate transporter 9-like [Vigna unguiculata]|uniref:aluminum-activated malate transporter 9-like n=1 Tax=Vigna unguiculata TaxID=3917 RepID=UPI0010165963|nr:aluminum-activated malate transporter 9-like [Vigna unguiculata]